MNTENNKIIAEFLGYELTTDGIQILYYDKDRDLKALPKYNSDWNSLMLVGSQCLTLIENEMWHEWEESLNEAVSTFDITITYNRIVKFIKWYNEQNK